MDGAFQGSSTAYQLNPRLRLTAYGGQFYAHDAALAQGPMVDLPTQRISAADYDTLRALKGQGVFLSPASTDDLRRALDEHGADTAMLDRWIGARFVLPHKTPTERAQDEMVQRLTGLFGPDTPPVPFAQRETHQRCFASNRFFNLPADTDPSTAHVAMVGLPFASLPISAGTQTAPDALRLQSRALSWLDFQKTGAYSDVVLTNGKPDIMGRGVVVQDCGDLRCAEQTPAGMYAALGTLLDDLDAHAIRPLFIGGDHAVTYPVVKAMLAREPRMGLLHFDAHNDLFYQGNVSFNHAAFLSNLLKDTGVEKVVSMGLRTTLDQRTQNMEQAYDRDDAGDRVSLVPLPRLKQLLASPRALRRAVSALGGRPYYITLDLDVMSEAAVAGQVSTPCGAGLEWHELHTLLHAIFAQLDIRGADVVEFNPGQGGGDGPARDINATLVRLIDGLARSGGKPRAYQEATDGT